MRNTKLFVLLCVVLIGCSSKVYAPVLEEEVLAQPKEDEIVDISFLAVGDNLIHETLYYYNKTRDFSSFYQEIKKENDLVDFSYINMETLCLGDTYGLSGYPVFNGPTEILRDVQNAGFDWLSLSSNHSMDKGENGVLAQLNIMDSFDQMVATGTHRSEEDRLDYKILEKEGVRIGLLSYTYGLNGFVLPEGKDYLVDLIDDERMKDDMEAISKISDIQLVSIHWGDEYQVIPNEYQTHYAQYLSDLGADVIIGSHPHVIQPVEFLEGSNGNKTLVYYSLGNFISHQYDAENMLGGMGKWKISYNKIQQTVEIKEASFYPTVTNIQRENYGYTFTTYLLRDYTNDMADTHDLTLQGKANMTREHLIDLVNSIMNDKVPIVY